MQLLKPEQINKKRKDQTRELTVRNDKLATSYKNLLKLQNDFEFDADKAKKVKDYEVWCEMLQKKKSDQLEELNKYIQATDMAREELYTVLARKDALEDSIVELQEEKDKLELQVKWQEGVLKNAL